MKKQKIVKRKFNIKSGSVFPINSFNSNLRDKNHSPANCKFYILFYFS